MLGWLKNLAKPGGEWRRTDLPEAELELLYQDLLPLETLEPGLAGDVMTYVVTGQNAGVLNRAAAQPEAARLLGLRCEKHSWHHRTPTERDAFFASTTITDPGFHLRLALAYEALLKPAEKRPVSPGIPAGAEWLEIYLWEATRTPPNQWPLEPQETRLPSQSLESMLKLSGHPTTWLARAALMTDPSRAKAAQKQTFAELFLKVPEAASAFTAHPDTVRECLANADHRGKAHIIDVLYRGGVSASLLPVEASALAVSSSKQVREATSSWILLTPDLLLPELQKLAVQGTPEERVRAVKLLAQAGRDMMTPFLMERLSRDRAKTVVKMIETVLHRP
ncbi:hypothetical protein DES53_102161 [Roseimicrobium gellanilyticum]|uniref:Uncharacterized protein n=1 Tax=Roseimicrobium gellanilyticum TaxID=748857 RepID=A0A366HRB9_9BACT|nr:hypothetical protein [Roseimicrobium gellanilyticum]RBP45779.1 hypothetical protein DES53_102161 [Roseimicrobium gellanilyticum]